jgi:hypothetical protein
MLVLMCIGVLACQGKVYFAQDKYASSRVGVAAGIFEVGRPKRLSVVEAQTLESQWQDVGDW